MFPSLRQAVRSFLRRDDGPTAVEYAVMMSLVFVVCVTSVITFGVNTGRPSRKSATAMRKTENKVLKSASNAAKPLSEASR